MARPPRVFLVACANDDALRHLQDTVLSGVNESTYTALSSVGAAGDRPIWGVSPGVTSTFEKVRPGDFLLFYTGEKTYRYAARVTETERNPDLAAALWRSYETGLRDDDEDLWPNIIHLDNVREVNIDSSDLHGLAGYSRDYVLGFQSLNSKATTTIREEYGSIEAYLRYWEAEGEPDAYDEATGDLHDRVAHTPELTEPAESYTETYRRARSAAFRKGLKEIYDYHCAVCESNRWSPTGVPEVEAAHIYPRSENGREDFRNGLTLCKLHHWAFDYGWISLDDDLRLLVRDRPDVNGYEDFAPLAGDEIVLPDDPEYHPARLYLGEHRRLNGFATA